MGLVVGVGSVVGVEDGVGAVEAGVCAVVESVLGGGDDVVG